MMLDFYSHREKVKRILLRQATALDTEWDPFAAAWIAYALSHDGQPQSRQFCELSDQLARWAADDTACSGKKHLGPRCMLSYLRRERGYGDVDPRARLSAQIRSFDAVTSEKFSPMNDPEQMFPMALLANNASLGDDVNAILRERTRSLMRGTTRRQVLYAAVLRELGESAALPHQAASPDAGDVIAIVWFTERYGPATEQGHAWQAYAAMKDGLCFPSEEPVEGLRALSIPETALLYEALARETARPNPNMLFEYYTLHHRVRAISGLLFRRDEYKNAVQEATQALNDFVKERTGCQKDEVSLVQATMRLPNATLRFNDRLNTDSGKNEQAGLALIAEGIFKAFRNPKAHSTKDAPHMQMDPHEALDQLAIISYMFNRAEAADVQVKKDGPSNGGSHA